MRGGPGQAYPVDSNREMGIPYWTESIQFVVSNVVIEEDMVFSIDIPMFHSPCGSLRIDEGFHVTSTGAEPLQKLSRVIEL